MAAKKIKIDNASFKFKKQTQRREQKVIRCSVLIVCEGTKTEPNYFDAFAQKQQGIIVYDIEVKGLGRGTKDIRNINGARHIKVARQCKQCRNGHIFGNA